MSTNTYDPAYAELKVVLLAGGVGGAKLAGGLAQILPPQNLTIIVNTGDDFEHFGLKVCPDLDTVMYTLSGTANSETGWGRAGDTWRTMAEVKRLGGPDWFSLGDLDLATHLTRTHMLAQGHSLTKVTRHLCGKLGIRPEVVPMSDQAAPTMIETESETLPFQTWFVKERWQPAVKGILLPESVKAPPRAMAALEQSDVVLLAPSNPFVSIDPILNVFPLREMVMDLPQIVLAVSPIIAGQAVKGPAAKMMSEMRLPVTAAAVADYYGDLIDGFVYDQQDAGTLDHTDLALLCVDTWMRTHGDRQRVSQDVMSFAARTISG